MPITQYSKKDAKFAGYWMSKGENGFVQIIHTGGTVNKEIKLYDKNGKLIGSASGTSNPLFVSFSNISGSFYATCRYDTPQRS